MQCYSVPCPAELLKEQTTNQKSYSRPPHAATIDFVAQHWPQVCPRLGLQQRTQLSRRLQEMWTTPPSDIGIPAPAFWESAMR
mmetsp:Transcript_38884/g.97695  ORF Transcript_38884/g.97695 Transcript_38884/m.97695 type:complete len:83 (+) Transcript_38884:1165-1413(+)